jgi:hypothetical protein
MWLSNCLNSYRWRVDEDFEQRSIWGSLENILSRGGGTQSGEYLISAILHPELNWSSDRNNVTHRR